MTLNASNSSNLKQLALKGLSIQLTFATFAMYLNYYNVEPVLIVGCRQFVLRIVSYCLSINAQ